MSNSNLPLGCANDPRAPWNEIEKKPFCISLKKEIYTECCGCDDFHESNGVMICNDCGQPCSIYEESESDFARRVEQEVMIFHEKNV